MKRECATCRDGGTGGDSECCHKCKTYGDAFPYWVDASKPHIVTLLIAFVVVVVVAAIFAGIGALIGGLTA